MTTTNQIAELADLLPVGFELRTFTTYRRDETGQPCLIEQGVPIIYGPGSRRVGRVVATTLVFDPFSDITIWHIEQMEGAGWTRGSTIDHKERNQP